MVIKEKVVQPQLGMIVFHQEIYHGNERMEIVGLRKTEVELLGDFSGGADIICKDWFPIDGLFRLKKICVNRAQPGGCQLRNVYCNYPDCEHYVLTKD